MSGAITSVGLYVIGGLSAFPGCFAVSRIICHYHDLYRSDRGLGGLMTGRGSAVHIWVCAGAVMGEDRRATPERCACRHGPGPAGVQTARSVTATREARRAAQSIIFSNKITVLIKLLLCGRPGNLNGATMGFG